MYIEYKYEDDNEFVIIIKMFSQKNGKIIMNSRSNLSTISLTKRSNLINLCIMSYMLIKKVKSVILRLLYMYMYFIHSIILSALY